MTRGLVATGSGREDARGQAGANGQVGRAKKRFGQHFLEPAWVAKLIDALDPRPEDTFFEIGPGRGALTRPLAPRVGSIIAIEIDVGLAAALPARLPENVRIVQGDVLDADLAALLHDARRPVRVVGNLPYNVASPILFRLLHGAEHGALLSDATLMLQKEVADRVAARPGSADYGALAIQVALLADVERVLTLPPGAFRPPPKVTSAVVRLRFRQPAEDVGDLSTFERIVRGLFQQRRKTVANALKPVADSLGRSAGQLLVAAGVDGRKRPEELSLAELARLSRAVL
jgi:16S rRNA (adenine1518-N6/adenine1519-N6)-dimethyltransferase